MLQPEVVHSNSPQNSPTLSPVLVPEGNHDQANALPPLEPSLANNHTNTIPIDAEASQPLEHCVESPGTAVEGSPVQEPAEVAAAPTEDDAAAAVQTEQTAVPEAAAGPEGPEAEVSAERHLHQELVLHCVGKVHTACVLVLSAHREPTIYRAPLFVSPQGKPQILALAQPTDSLPPSMPSRLVCRLL